MGNPEPKVLLIAEAANPEWVSVPLVGWSLSQAMAKKTPAHIVTQVRNRDAFIRAGLVEGKDFTAIDSEAVAAPLHRLAQRLRGGEGKGWTIGTAFSSLAYYAFEREFWRQFGPRIRAGEFDLVHRITPLSPTSQSIIARRLAKIGVPFVVGPLNGGVPWPKGFVDRQHAEGEWLSHVRGLYKLLPGYRLMRRHSSAIIVGSKHTHEQMPIWCHDRCVYIPENGIDPGRFSSKRTHKASLPLKAAFLGRLVPYKGADILIRAATRFLQAGELELHIVGDGPQRSSLAGLVEERGLGDHVSFHGWAAHEDVQKILRGCDFLALPSVREFGGGVVLEAMALGLTPIIADYAGPSELITDQTGIRVPFHGLQSLIRGFEAAIGSVIRSPEILDRIGEAACERVAKFYTWEKKAEQIMRVYQWVLGQGDKPDYSVPFDCE